LQPGFSKGSDKSVLSKTRCKYGQLHAVLSEDFCVHKILSLKSNHIFRDNERAFRLVLHILSLVAKIRMY